MTSIQTKEAQSIQYPPRTVKRAELAMRCLPFQLPLFAAMRNTSVPLGAIAQSAAPKAITQSVPAKLIALQDGVECHYTKRPMSELAVESGLMWLIQVGILRREVDGQGITDGFRLTPLGRQLIEKWEKQGGKIPAPSWLDRLYNALNRWLRLPF